MAMMADGKPVFVFAGVEQANRFRRRCRRFGWRLPDQAIEAREYFVERLPRIVERRERIRSGVGKRAIADQVRVLLQGLQQVRELAPRRRLVRGGTEPSDDGR